jgi:prophage regulatory protein
MDARDRIVKEPERKQITSIGASSAWRGEKVGTFPKRIRLGEHSVGWKLSELMAWVESREVATPENTKPVAPGAKRGRKPRIARREV